MEPVSPIYPINIPPEVLGDRVLVPQYSPMRRTLSAPAAAASYGPISYSPQTGLLYVNAIDRPSGRARELAGLEPADGYFSAYDPTTGELVWRQIFEGYGQAGSVVTAGGVVFVGTGSNIAGYFFAFDAATGEKLLAVQHRRRGLSSPSMYMVDGEQFVTVASGGGDRGRRGGDLILSFALPPR